MPFGHHRYSRETGAKGAQPAIQGPYGVKGRAYRSRGYDADPSTGTAGDYLLAGACVPRRNCPHLEARNVKQRCHLRRGRWISPCEPARLHLTVLRYAIQLA